MTNSQSNSNALFDSFLKAGEARPVLERLLHQDEWAVISIGLIDDKPLLDLYGQPWQDAVSELIAKQIIQIRSNFASLNCELIRLTSSSFLFVIQASSQMAAAIRTELHKAFQKEIPATFPENHVKEGIVSPYPGRLLPMASLAIAIVSAKDGPFSNVAILYRTLSERRTQRERLALLSHLNSLEVKARRLREAGQTIEIAPALNGMIEQFAAFSTELIHDLRNGLAILSEDLKNISLAFPALKEEKLEARARYCRRLLETVSEVRFKGGSTAEKVAVSELLVDVIGMRVHQEFLDWQINPLTESVHIYADRSQITLALFNLLEWLTAHNGIGSIASLTCHPRESTVQFILGGQFIKRFDPHLLTEQSIDALQNEHQPSLYVCQKLLLRNEGQLAVDQDSVTIALPRYRGQDVQSADQLLVKANRLKQEIEALENSNGAGASPVVGKENVGPGADFMQLAGTKIDDLFHELNWLYRFSLTQASDESESRWLSLKASSYYCYLLVANLLVAKNKNDIDLVPTDITTVLAAVKFMLLSKTRNLPALNMVWEVPEKLPRVLADETLLAQLIMNLALNSIQELTRTRPDNAQLLITVVEEPDHIEIKISDTGTGIPNEIVTRLFNDEATFQIGRGEKGMGLQIVKSIVQKFGGQLKIDASTTTAGTSVTITFPIWVE